MSVHFIDRQSQLESLLPTLMSKPSWGVDSETTGLCPFASDVLAWQFGRPEDQYVIDNREVNMEVLRPFFESKEHMKILHNAKFDYKMGAVNNKLEMEYMRCTQLAEQLMEQGRLRYKGKFTLGRIARDRLNVDLDKETQSSFIGHTGPFNKRQISYMGEDVEYLLPLLQNQTKDIIKAGLGQTFKLECDFIPSLGDMELGGFKLNVPHWQNTMKENSDFQEEARKKLDRYSRQFFQETLFGDVDINYASSHQILKLYAAMKMKVKVWDRDKGKEVEIPFGKGEGKWSKTGKKDTKSINSLPIVKLVEEYRSYNVLINTFGQPYIDAINPHTNRIHGEFWQLGTETGRLSSSSKVNFLNLPRDLRFRHGFEAYDDDHVVETDDYSGCELRIWADLSKDPGLTEAFNKGIDVHCHVASKLYRVEVTKKNENAKLRTPAKNINFGWLNAA